MRLDINYREENCKKYKNMDDKQYTNNKKSLKNSKRKSKNT